MSRTVKRPTQNVESPNRSRVEQTDKPKLKEYLRIISDALKSEQCRIIVGIILVVMTAISLCSCISFFFTGAEDFSIVTDTSLTRAQMREEIHNIIGLTGAMIAYGLIDCAFGVVILFALLAAGAYSLRLLLPLGFRRLRLLFITLFVLVWGSVVMGYVQQYLGTCSFFRWGGAFGEYFAQLGISYMRGLGMFFVLLALLIIFLVVVDKHFSEHCQQFANWVKGLFKKNDDPAEQEATEEEDEEPMIIELTPTDDTNPDTPSTEELPVLVVDVDTPQAEEVVIQVEEEENENAEPIEEVDINIQDVSEVELTEEDPDYLLKKLGPYDPRKDLEFFKFPPLSLLKVYDNETAPVIDKEEQQANANRIVTTLRNYGIEIESIKATVGPTVTLYEIVPQAGVRVSKIQNLENDIMLSLSAMGIRIIAPIPGKGTIGIEVPNEKPQVVSMHSVIASKRFQEEQKMRLPIAYGRTITNEVFMFDLAKTPHLLVAGATGTGKSVAINAIITSLLYKKHPAELKMVLVDPKMVEFAPYKPLLRHYLAATPDTDPEQVVITDCDKVVNTLNSLVIEMENRYKLLMDAGVRNLEDYNDKFVSRRLNPEKVVADSLHHQFLPYIVIIIDEYGDFIMQAGKQVETPIARITQKARAVGMHMILATQRPSVNIVTGVIKANIPTRIALRTQSVIDSRTVLDNKGAEQLIGRGDSLYAGNASIIRMQCALVETPEVDAIVEHIEKQQRYFEPYQLPEYVGEGGEGEALAPGAVDLKRLDPMFADVARYVVTKQEGSTSRLQRAFEIGYNRAGKLSDQLEAAGIVGPNKGPKGRDVLVQSLDELDRILKELDAL
jgi:S-DNA-T family DNA segregation ATPase FtsK/SpoIIIE